VECGKSTTGKMWNDSTEEFRKLPIADFSHFTTTRFSQILKLSSAPVSSLTTAWLNETPKIKCQNMLLHRLKAVVCFVAQLSVI